MVKTCAAHDCRALISAKHLFCSAHWFALERQLRDQLFAAWVEGLQYRMHPTQAFTDLMAQALRAIEHKKQQQTARV
jgi:hypothetical protein